MGRDLRKTATAQATPGKRTQEKRADENLSRGPLDPPSLKKFKTDPLEGARALLRLRNRKTIEELLADAEFAATLKALASKATKSPSAAAVLSRLALRPEFSSVAAAAIGAAGSWPEPSTFAAKERRLAADALERARPGWASSWLAKALLSALPHVDHRRFFASRLLLSSGGLAGAMDALTRSLGAPEARPKKVGRDYLTLIRELRRCSRPAATVPSAQAAFVEFARTVISDRSASHDAQVRLELAQLLQDGAAADRELLLDDRVLEIVTSLDEGMAAQFRAEAAKHVATGQKAPRLASGAASSQAELMYEAASSDADQALGRALQDMGVLARQFEQLEATVEGNGADCARRAKGASDLVLQWVRQAARHRNIAILGKRGERVTFDPELHHLEGEASPGDYVRVVKPPIVRENGSQQVVVLRGEVESE